MIFNNFRPKKFYILMLNSLRNVIWNALLFFTHSRVKLTGLKPVPGHQSRPRIMVSLHRNGLMDLFLIRYLCPEVLALTSVQWHQNFFTRWLIGGVGVSRAKDRVKKIQADSFAALGKCAELINQGQTIGIAPEGTSHLGPGHLPFQKAAARVAAKVLESRSEITVIPLSPVYLEAWAWRSPAELYAGPELVFRPGQKMNEIHQIISRALADISLKAENLPELMARQAAAWEVSAAAPQPGVSFSTILLESDEELLCALGEAHNHLARRLPEKALFFGAIVPDGLKSSGAGEYRPALISLIALGALNILWALSRLMVWPALVLSRRIRRGLVDDLNVVALWRAIAALPLIGLWLLLPAFLAAYCFGPWGAAGPWLLALGAWFFEPARLRLRAAVWSVKIIGRSALKDYFSQLTGLCQKCKNRPTPELTGAADA